MAHYLMKYKGIYRVLPELDMVYHDLPREENGDIAHEDIELYIPCQYGNKITECRHDPNGRVVLKAHIYSIGRAKNIKRAMDEKGVPYTDYYEADKEAEFCFRATDIAPIAELMKAKTFGANISPFSTKNLPKSDVEIPLGEIEKYKAIIADVGKNDILIIHKTTTEFLEEILAKRYKKTGKKKNSNTKFDYKLDMRKMMMSRQAKEYIYTKGLWNEYLEYLQKGIKKFYKEG